MSFATDGLPQHYYDVIHDRFKMNELRNLLESVLPGLHPDEQTAQDVLDVTNINPMFFDEVEEMVHEWKENTQKDLIMVLEEGV